MPVRRTQDWHVVGVIEVATPGRYEVLFSNASGIAIRPIGDEDDIEGSLVTIEVGGTQVLHSCSPCTCCAACACRDGGDLCAGCRAYRAWARSSEPGLERYQAACADPEGWFVVTGSNIVHAVGCSSLASTVKSVIGVLDGGCQHRYGYEPRPPDPVRAEAIRGGRRCRVCSPDVIPPARGSGRFAAGGRRDV